MTKQEYNEKWSLSVKEEHRLKEERIQMDIDYIKEHSEFGEGDRVKIIHPDGKCEEGFVYRIYVSSGDINYQFLQVKKDGSHSSRNLHLPMLWRDGDQYKYELLKKWEEPKTETI